MAEARRLVPESTVLMGNINPSDPMCIGTPDQVRSCVQDVIHKTRAGLILSSGCAWRQHKAGEHGRAGGVRQAVRHPGAAGGAAKISLACPWGQRPEEKKSYHDPYAEKRLPHRPDQREGGPAVVHPHGGRHRVPVAGGSEILGGPGAQPFPADRPVHQQHLHPPRQGVQDGHTRFIKDTVLAPAECGDSRLVLACEDTEETRAIYPFRFRYAIAYTLEHQTLHITVTVDNRDSQTMYFSVGGHPGFNLPLEEGLAYDDYCLQFPAGATAKRAECTPGDCIMLDQITDYPLVHDRIPLSHELFAQRVLILTDMPGRSP